MQEESSEPLKTTDQSIINASIEDLINKKLENMVVTREEAEKLKLVQRFNIPTLKSLDWKSLSDWLFQYDLQADQIKLYAGVIDIPVGMYVDATVLRSLMTSGVKLGDNVAILAELRKRLKAHNEARAAVIIPLIQKQVKWKAFTTLTESCDDFTMQVDTLVSGLNLDEEDEKEVINELIEKLPTIFQRGKPIKLERPTSGTHTRNSNRTC